MTDKQRAAKLEAAVRELKRTAAGYLEAPNGPRWRNGLAGIEAVVKDLRRPPIPQLGPLVLDGLATLLMY